MAKETTTTAVNGTAADGSATQQAAPQQSTQQVAEQSADIAALKQQLADQAAQAERTNAELADLRRSSEATQAELDRVKKAAAPVEATFGSVSGKLAEKPAAEAPKLEPHPTSAGHLQAKEFMQRCPTTQTIYPTAPAQGIYVANLREHVKPHSWLDSQIRAGVILFHAVAE